MSSKTETVRCFEVRWTNGVPHVIHGTATRSTKNGKWTVRFPCDAKVLRRTAVATSVKTAIEAAIYLCGLSLAPCPRISCSSGRQVKPWTLAIRVGDLMRLARRCEKHGLLEFTGNEL